MSSTTHAFNAAWFSCLAALAAVPQPALGAGPVRSDGTSAAVAPPKRAPEPAGAGVTTLYRSTMPDGGVVLGDRPEPGARAVETIGAVPSTDRTEVARARQEREYWRERAEAFARRQLLREIDDEREPSPVAGHQQGAANAPLVLGGPPILYRPRSRLDYTGQPVLSEYGTSPGAAGRNLATSNAAPSGFGPGVGGVGVGIGGIGMGAASSAGAGFIGSGFARSTR